MKKRKGIILAGGMGSRLFPITFAISKQLLPVYDKPMIYYPLSALMLAQIKDILIISSPEHINLYKNLLGDGSQLGMSFSYIVQDKPRGLADAFILGENFIEDNPVALVLGDNIFYGNNFADILLKTSSKNDVTIFGYKVDDPERFGVLSFSENMQVISVEEKPENPKSNYAITGLYFFDNDVVDIAKSVKPSNRGELEITSIINEYIIRNSLRVELMEDDSKWLDTGTNKSLLEASNFVQKTEETIGYKIGCIEEIAYKNKWVSKEKLIDVIKKYKDNEYSLYLKNII
ncbi:glucose-1-phosphate thymidylyltransferase RfbA [Gammaproteobacteria bacterium]|nr:glucose-1-phosphate thymidylyltransferase RfbA [Gammaproteobacteria bacterium]